MNMRPGLLIAALLLASPASALAEPSKDGVGANMKHLANITYPELTDAGGEYTTAGTDFEFAVVTLKGKALKDARKQFGRRMTDVDAALKGIQRRLAVAGSYEDGLHMIDVSDPDKPVKILSWPCSIAQGDVQVFTRADKPGRTYATYTQDDGYEFDSATACWKEAEAKGYDVPSGNGTGGGTFILDITDPFRPSVVSFIKIDFGSHNQTVHPSGQWLYNSNADLITNFQPAIEIIDIRDLAQPKLHGTLPLLTLPGLGTQSHDITFSADGKRAYSAALSHGAIIDTTDPGKPVRLSQVIDPTLNVWHQMEAVTIDDPILGEREFLIAEDEFAGAEGTSQCPNGGVHVYDITGELQATPVPVGYWNIDEIRPTGSTDLAEAYTGRCTAHVFQLHREAKLMTIAYYNAGVRVVDISGLVGVALGSTGMGMKQLGWFRFPDSDTWAAKAFAADRKGFFIFGNDKIRGFDAYRYEPAGESVSPGVWLSPQQLASKLSGFRMPDARKLGRLAALCMLGPARGR